MANLLSSKPRRKVGVGFRLRWTTLQTRPDPSIECVPNSSFILEWPTTFERRTAFMSYFGYLGDRLHVPGSITVPPLPDLVRQAAAAT